MKNLIKPLPKIVLIPLGLTAGSAADAGIPKKILGSGSTTLIILNDELEDIMKIVTSLKDSGLLLKGVSKTIQNEAKEHLQKTTTKILPHSLTNFEIEDIRMNLDLMEFILEKIYLIN